MKKKFFIKPLLFGILTLLSTVPFITEDNINRVGETKNELFQPELIEYNSTSKLIHAIDSLYLQRSQNALFDTSLYVQTASDFVKNRFFHGLSTYSISDNWIAYLAGKLFWPHFLAIVKPDDLLKHSEGLCSQQTIVLLEVLERKGIAFRTVGLGYNQGPGHFLSEVRYNGKWHLHDVTKEPQWSKVVNHHLSMDYYLLNKDSLYIAYEGKLSRPIFDKILEKVEYGDLNEFPAKNMLLFHNVTKFATFLLPVFFLSLCVYFILRK